MDVDMLKRKTQSPAPPVAISTKRIKPDSGGDTSSIPREHQAQMVTNDSIHQEVTFDEKDIKTLSTAVRIAVDMAQNPEMDFGKAVGQAIVHFLQQLLSTISKHLALKRKYINFEQVDTIVAGFDNAKKEQLFKAIEEANLFFQFRSADVITSKVARTKRGEINEGGMRNTPDNETGEGRKWKKWIEDVRI
jgi:hypothetical protein